MSYSSHFILFLFYFLRIFMDFLWIFYLVMIVVFLGRKLYIFVCDFFERDERGKKEMYACFVRVEWNEKRVCV